MRYFLATLLLHTTSAQLFETRLLLIKVPSMHISSTNSAIALAIQFLQRYFKSKICIFEILKRCSFDKFKRNP